MSTTEPEPVEEATSASTPEAEAEAMAKLDRARLPVQTLAEAIPHLRRPFTPEAIRFKVQTVFGDNYGCLVVAYIDQRLVTERLNRVIPSWSAEYKPGATEKFMWCRLTIDGVSRTDIGESRKGLSKDLVSDALKRAAVPFGVGVSCYALPQIKLMMSESHGRIELRGKGDKQTIALTEHGMVKLREGYAKWLEEHGVKRFGPPLDHGDVVGATIAEEYEIGQGEGDGSEPGWTDMRPDLIERIEAVLARAVATKFPGFTSRATVQMKLNGQKLETIETWIAEATAQLDAMEVPDAEVVAGEGVQETLNGGQDAN